MSIRYTYSTAYSSPVPTPQPPPIWSACFCFFFFFRCQPINGLRNVNGLFEIAKKFAGACRTESGTTPPQPHCSRGQLSIFTRVRCERFARANASLFRFDETKEMAEDYKCELSIGTLYCLDEKFLALLKQISQSNNHVLTN